MGIPIEGTARGNPDTAYARAMQRGAQRPAFLHAYLTALYADAATLGINADALVAQADLETDSFRSAYWVLDGNPAGIAAFDDGSNLGVTFTPETAARVHVTHMAAYLGLFVSPAWIATDPRWQAVIDAGWFGSVTTTDDLGSGKWATDEAYPLKLLARNTAYWGAPQLETPMATHRYVLSAGHRNTNKGGASGEYAWTPGATRALRDAIVARGGKAVIIQEIAGSGDFFDGGLQAAASACVTAASKHGPFDAYISMHYNGGNSPGFHVIFPDAHTGGDTKANNPLDVRLCRRMRDAVRDTNTVRMLSWTGDSPGVMSEKETGVGAQGYRLGEFVGTLGFRDTTARVILEASSIDVASERRYITDPGWVRNVYCEALVDALEAEFGVFKAERPDAMQPAPAPIPTPLYDVADPIPELATLPAYVKLGNGSQLIRVDTMVKATKDTPRLKWADPASPKIGPDISAGEVFEVDYLIVNTDGSLFWYSPWATRFLFADAVPYFADVDDTVTDAGTRVEEAA